MVADVPLSEDALVAAGAAAPDLACAAIALILWIASSLRCLKARRSSILPSLLALSCELSGGDKPGGIDGEAWTPKESSVFEAGNRRAGSAARAIAFALSVNAFSRSSNAFSRASNSALR